MKGLLTHRRTLYIHIYVHLLYTCSSCFIMAELVVENTENSSMTWDKMDQCQRGLTASGGAGSVIPIQRPFDGFPPFLEPTPREILLRGSQDQSEEEKEEDVDPQEKHETLELQKFDSTIGGDNTREASMVLLDSASHSIREERQKVAWSRINCV